MGQARDRRAALLAEAGVEARLLPEAVPDELLASLQLLFVAGLAEGEARELAARARALGCWSMSRMCCRSAIFMSRPLCAGAICC